MTNNWKAMLAGGVIAIGAIWVYHVTSEPDTPAEQFNEAVEEFNDEIDDNT